MAIYLTFSRIQTLTALELIEDRLHACYETVKFFERSLFFPHQIEVWFTATSEAFGGTLSRVIPIENLFEATNAAYSYIANLQFQQRLKTIVIYRGIWEINGIKMAGYFSAQNSNDWRKVYGDIEISAYSKGEIKDLVEALWSLPEIEGIISNFVDNFARVLSQLKIRLSRIVFCHGVWSKDDPASIMAIYLTGARRHLLGIFYFALKEQRDKDIAVKFRPLSTKFLLDMLEKNKIVEERINERLNKNIITELPAKSALYIAKRNDSFGKLYTDISNAVLKPALSKLDEEEVLRKKIENGLAEYRE